MVFSGTGILMSSMQVLPEEEDDFNHWFDTEHLPERVAIPGFLDARRYESISMPVRYLQIYNAVDMAALDSTAYRAALAQQTPWSMHHITRFIDPTRVVGCLVGSRGSARGCAVVLIRLRPLDEGRMRSALQSFLSLVDGRRVLSVHAVEGDAELSKPVTVTGPHPGSGDGYVIVECTGLDVAQAIAANVVLPDPGAVQLIDASVYRFRLDLSATSLPAATA